MGYKAKFSPRFFRSKCKPSPLPCLPWDSVGGVGQGWFRILHKSGIEFPGAGRSPGLAVWPGMLGRLAAWVDRLGGGLIGCRWWAALLCCDFLCAPSLFSPLRLCWVLALPCVLWRWLSPGSCWPLLGVDCLGAAGCWLWLRLGFPGSRLSALVQGWRVSRPCRWWWLGWVMGRRWAWWLAYPVRQIAQIKPCRFGYYSREKR